MEQRASIDDLVRKYSQLNGLDPDLVRAVIHIESSWNPRAVNKSSMATGLMQVMPRDVSDRYGGVFRDRPSSQELLDPETNIAWGTHILANYLQLSGGDIREALRRYSGGYSDSVYAQPVLELYQRYKRGELQPPQLEYEGGSQQGQQDVPTQQQSWAQQQSWQGTPEQPANALLGILQGTASIPISNPMTGAPDIPAVLAPVLGLRYGRERQEQPQGAPTSPGQATQRVPISPEQATEMIRRRGAAVQPAAAQPAQQPAAQAPQQQPAGLPVQPSLQQPAQPMPQQPTAQPTAQVPQRQPAGPQAEGREGEEDELKIRVPVTAAPGTPERAYQRHGYEYGLVVSPREWPTVFAEHITKIPKSFGQIGEQLGQAVAGQIGGRLGKTVGTIFGAVFGTLTGFYQTVGRPVAALADIAERALGTLAIVGQGPERTREEVEYWARWNRAKAQGDQQTIEQLKQEALQALLEDPQGVGSKGQNAQNNLAFIGNIIRAKKEDWRNAWNAAAVGAYTPGLAETAWVRIADGGEDPEEVAYDLIQQQLFTQELVGQLVLDPGNIVQGLVGKAVKMARYRNALRLLAPTSEPLEAIEATMKRTSSASGLMRIAHAINPFAMTAESKRGRLVEEATDIARLLTSADPTPAGKMQIIREWLSVANESELQEFARRYNMPIATSVVGKRANVVARTLNENDRLVRIVRAAAKQAEEEGLRGYQFAERILRALTDSTNEALKQLVPDQPTIYERVFGKVLKWRAPLDNRLAELYLGMNPQFVARNAYNNFVTAVADGVWPFASAEEIANFKERFGAWPMAAAKAITPAERRSPPAANLRELAQRILRKPHTGGIETAQYVERWFSERIVYKSIRGAMNALWPKRLRRQVVRIAQELNLTPEQTHVLYYNLLHCVSPGEVRDVLRRFVSGDPSVLARAVPPELAEEALLEAPEAAEAMAKAAPEQVDEVVEQVAQKSQQVIDNLRQTAPKGSPAADLDQELLQKAQRPLDERFLAEKWYPWRSRIVGAENRINRAIRAMEMVNPDEARRLIMEEAVPASQLRSQLYDRYFNQTPNNPVRWEEIAEQIVRDHEERARRVEELVRQSGINLESNPLEEAREAEERLRKARLRFAQAAARAGITLNHDGTINVANEARLAAVMRQIGIDPNVKTIRIADLSLDQLENGIKRLRELPVPPFSEPGEAVNLLRARLGTVFGIRDKKQQDAVVAIMDAMARYSGQNLDDFVRATLANILPAEPTEWGTLFARAAGGKKPKAISDLITDTVVSHVAEIYGREVAEQARDLVIEAVSGGHFSPSIQKFITSSPDVAENVLSYVAYLKLHHALGDYDSYNSAINQMRMMINKASSWKALMANSKTILSLDVSKNCPFAAMGHPCAFCYVELPRGLVELLGEKRPMAPALRLSAVPYNGELLALEEMPELVEFTNDLGGIRMFSIGDYRPAVSIAEIRDSYLRQVQVSEAVREQKLQEFLDIARRQGLIGLYDFGRGPEEAVITDKWVERILQDAQEVGLRVKAITKQREFVERYADRFPNLFVNFSVDMDPAFTPDFSGIAPRLQAVLESARHVISNAPTVEQVWNEIVRGRSNVVVRYVSLFGPEEAIKALADPRVAVVTPLHIERTNPALAAHLIAHLWGDEGRRNLGLIQELASQLYNMQHMQGPLGKGIISPARWRKYAQTRQLVRINQQLLDKIFGPGNVTVGQFLRAIAWHGGPEVPSQYPIHKMVAAALFKVPGAESLKLEELAVPFMEGKEAKYGLPLIEFLRRARKAGAISAEDIVLRPVGSVPQVRGEGMITQELLDSILGQGRITLDEFLQAARHKVCCQTTLCSTCPACCGANPERVQRMLHAVLFEGMPVAAVEFLEDGRALISAVQQPGLGPFLHELGHVFRRHLNPDELRIVHEWAGLNVGDPWPVELEEKFADSFVEYLRSGVAPKPEMQGIFEQFKRWLQQIWQAIKNHLGVEEVHPKLREVFDTVMKHMPVEDYPELAGTPQGPRVLSAVGAVPTDGLDETAGRWPVLFAQIADSIKQNAGKVQPVVLPQDKLEAFFRWSDELISDLNHIKAAAMRVGSQMRNLSLLDYSQRRAFDTVLSAFLIYPYWASRTYPLWAVRLAMNPAMLGAYLRYKRALAISNKDAPEWLKDQLRIHVPGLPEPVYFNIESSINPLYNLIESFDDPDRKKTALGELLVAIDKLGFSPYPALVWAYAIERGLRGDKEAAVAALGHLAPVTRAVRAATGLLHVGPPGGVTLEPWLWRGTPLFGGDKWTMRRVGRRIAELEMRGEITTTEARAAARALATGDATNPVLRRAMEMEVEQTGPSTLVAFVLGTGFKGRRPSDVEIDDAMAEQDRIYALTGQVSDEEWRRLWQEYYRKYPWMRTISLSRADREAADTAWTVEVLNRLPPGQKHAILQAHGVPSEVIDKFYELRRDQSDVGGVPRRKRAVAELPEPDRMRFMAAILELAEEYGVPAPPLNDEWEEARRRYRELMEIANQLFPGVAQLEQQYYALLDRNKSQAAAFAQQHPEIWARRQWINEAKASDRLLAWYYGRTPRDQAIDYIWSVYRSQDQTGRKVLRSALGQEFRDYFLNRNYDRISDELLYQWVTALGGRLYRTAKAEAPGAQVPAPEGITLTSPSQMGPPRAEDILQLLGVGP